MVYLTASVREKHLGFVACAKGEGGVITFVQGVLRVFAVEPHRPAYTVCARYGGKNYRYTVQVCVVGKRKGVNLCTCARINEIPTAFGICTTYP